MIPAGSEQALAQRIEAAELVLLFDGTCGFCTWCARWASSRDAAHRLFIIPNQTEHLLEHLGFTRLEADRAALAVDRRGRRYRGAAAVNRTFRELGPPWRQLAALYPLPVVRQVEDLAYALVSVLRPGLSALVRVRPALEVPRAS